MANLAAMSLRHPLAVIFLMVMAMALIWSKALLSIMMVFLAFVALVDIRVNPFKMRLIPFSDIRNSIRTKPFIWVFALYWLIYMISIFYAGNLSEWWSLTHPKFAFLLIPMSFAMLRPFTRREFMLIVLCMIIMTVWSTIWIQVAYYSNYELFSKSLGYGASLPTPGSHIRFSVITAASLILCLGFAIENWKVKYNWERWAYGLTAAYLFYFLHILSVRSGLVIGYAGILLMVVFYLRKLKSWQQLTLIAIIVIAPIFAYKTFPGFQLKVHYTLYDLKKYKEGQGDDYSDAQRWDSWHAGLVIGNHHPFFGAGTGRFHSELTDYYTSESKEFNWRPQNQWINVFAIFGLFGLVIFTFTLIYPMTFSFFWRPPMMPVLYIMQLIHMLVEHPLDTEVGTALFLIITLLGMSYQNGIGNENKTYITKS